MIRYPIRKDYVIKYKTEYGIYTIRYKQALAKDTIQFYSLEKNELFKYLVDFVKNNGEYSYNIKRTIFTSKRYLRNRKALIEAKILNKVLSDGKLLVKIKETLHNPGKSLYEDIILRGERSIDNIMYLSLCKEYNIVGPNELLENYTMEQIIYMLDGIIYMNNAMDKKTRYMNRMAVNKLNGGDNPEKIDRIKKFRSILQGNKFKK